MNSSEEDSRTNAVHGEQDDDQGEDANMKAVTAAERLRRGASSDKSRILAFRRRHATTRRGDEEDRNNTIRASCQAHQLKSNGQDLLLHIAHICQYPYVIGEKL